MDAANGQALECRLARYLGRHLRRQSERNGEAAPPLWPAMRLAGQLVPCRVRARPPGMDGNLREPTTLGKCHLAKAA